MITILKNLPQNSSCYHSSAHRSWLPSRLAELQKMESIKITSVYSTNNLIMTRAITIKINFSFDYISLLWKRETPLALYNPQAAPVYNSQARPDILVHGARVQGSHTMYFLNLSISIILWLYHHHHALTVIIQNDAPLSKDRNHNSNKSCCRVILMEVMWKNKMHSEDHSFVRPPRMFCNQISCDPSKNDIQFKFEFHFLNGDKTESERTSVRNW